HLSHTPCYWPVTFFPYTTLFRSHYYVYMYQSVQLPSGKWGKKTGKSIGTIIADKGFIPNRNYHLYEGTQSQDEITVLEYGQYARSEEHTSELQSRFDLVCRLLLE